MNTEYSYCPYGTSLIVSLLHCSLCHTHSCALAL